MLPSLGGSALSALDLPRPRGSLTVDRNLGVREALGLLLFEAEFGVY